MSNQVTWNDYQGVDGFGSSSQTDVDNLNKALAAGQEQNPPGSATAGDGFALRVESLERTLINTTYKMTHIRLFRAIEKIPAYNTVEEHNELSSYGDNSDNGFVAEGDLASENSSTYQRKFAVVKYMGTTRTVTHVMTMVKPAHGSVIASETINGTMDLLQMVERALFYGNSDLQDLQFDGYEKLIEDNSPATNVVDLRGQPLSQDILDDVCLTVSDAPNYGTPTHLHINPKVHSDFSKAFYPKERHDTFAATKDGMVGNAIRGFVSPAGNVMFEPNVFITDGGGPPAAATGPASTRPGVPTISSSVTTPASATLSQYDADDAGDYFLSVCAVNRYGRSAAVAVDASAVTIAEDDKFLFGVTPGGATDVDYYEVYRTLKSGLVAAQRSVLKVVNAAGTGETLVSEYNANIPYASSGFLFQQNSESMRLKQLAPMLKMPLAQIDARIRWMQLIYLVPVLYAPKKNILLKNIGRASGFVGAP